MSETFPYTASVGKIKDLMQKIRERKVPKGVSDTWFDFLDLNKKDNSDMFEVLKFIGFIDEAKKPTPIWSEYKSSEKPKEALEKAIRKSYHKLFSGYPDANTKSKLEIADYFRKNSSLEDEVITKAARTFLNLCSSADFGDKQVSKKEKQEVKVPEKSDKKVTITKPISDDTRKQNNPLSEHQSELFDQARLCIENKIFGAAHVIAWVGFMDYLGDKLSSYGIKEIIADNEKFSKLKIESIEDLRENVFEYEIIKLSQEIKIFSKSEMKVIHGLLSKRNECAHPSNYKPGLNETLGYVDELLNRINAIESKKIV